jgi:pimeloyl-ACP methyl ester carboxylesterase
MWTHEQFNTFTSLIFEDYGPPPGRPEAPVILYLPGVQGDWTPMWHMAPLVAEHFRLIVTAYPRQCTWTLDDHATAALNLMDELRLGSVHLLAESFGSLVGWALTLRAPERVRSIVLAGGFSQSPQPVGARLARHLMHWVSPHFLDDMVKMYVNWIAGPEVRKNAQLCAQAFMAVKSKPGWRACANRMRIIYGTDLRARLGEIRVPVGYIGGERDRIVPVRREIATLQQSLAPACRFRAHLIPREPHPILAARPYECTQWLSRWITELEIERVAAV